MPISGYSITRSVSSLLIAGLLLAQLGCAQAASRTPLLKALPEIKKDCAICHVLEEGKRTDRLKKQLSGLCLDCHLGRVAPSEHKVDIVPSMQVSGLPLTDGKITCITCHDPHANRYGTLLRLKETDLCLACHPY